MDRDYKREYIDEVSEQVFEMTKIGVCSFINQSGTSFVATSLAKNIADKKKKSVAYIDLKHYEGNEPLLYDALGMEHRFASREFISFYAEIKEGNYIKKLRNMESGINWSIRTSKDRDLGIVLTPMEEIKLLHNIMGDLVICDLGSHYYNQLIEEMDVLIIVIDPKPANLLTSKNQLNKLRVEELGGRNLLWVINKYNHGVNNKLLKRFLKLKNPVMIPLIPEEWFYVAQYRCRIPFEQLEIRNGTLMQIEEIVNNHILFT